MNRTLPISQYIPPNWQELQVHVADDPDGTHRAPFLQGLKSTQGTNSPVNNWKFALYTKVDK